MDLGEGGPESLERVAHLRPEILLLDLPGESLRDLVQQCSLQDKSKNKNGTYFKPTAVDLTQYRGKTIQIVLHASCDDSKVTSFRVDDVSLPVHYTNEISDT